MRVRRCILLTALVVAWTVAPAQSQWVATPYLGINISGDVEAGKGGPGGSSGTSAAGWDSSSISNVTFISSRTRMLPTSFPIPGWTSILTP